jgi:hypothetical protein
MVSLCISLYRLRGILLDQCLAEPNLPAARKALSSFHSVSYGARYTVVSWSTRPSRTRSSHPTRPRTFLLIDASAKKYTVENVVTPRAVISTSCPNASKLLFAVRNRFRGAFAGSRPSASASSFRNMQKVAPVSTLAASRRLFSPAFNTTGTEMPSRSLLYE